MNSSLDTLISELYRLEPYWLMCKKCNKKGLCCVGADISIDDSEWLPIVGKITELPLEEKNILNGNIANGYMCCFRASTKCLIHDIRPSNCKYTPYQAVITKHDMIMYAMVSPKCKVESVERSATPTEKGQINSNFIVLNSFGRPITYLLLNRWAKENYVFGDQTKQLSERMASIY